MLTPCISNPRPLPTLARGSQIRKDPLYSGEVVVLAVPADAPNTCLCLVHVDSGAGDRVGETQNVGSCRALMALWVTPAAL